MKDLAPDIVRRRLLIEGLYSKPVDQAAVETYLIEVAAHLGLRTYGRPIVHSPDDMNAALHFTRDFFAATALEHRPF